MGRLCSIKDQHFENLFQTNIGSISYLLQLKAKYDPEDQYIQKYRESASARGITI